MQLCSSSVRLLNIDKRSIMIPQIRNWCFFFMLIAISIFSAISSETPSTCDSSTISECENRLLLEAEKFTVGYRQCLLRQLRNKEIKIWYLLSSAIRSCLGREKFSKALNMTRIGQRKPAHLSKVVILPSETNSSCVAVTARSKELVGKGSAEEELVRLLPKIELHVADPDPNTNIPSGKFYNNVISFRELGDATWNRYAEKIGFDRNKVDPLAVTLKNFLEKHVKEPRVDILWIDFQGIDFVHAPNEKPFIPPDFAFAAYPYFLDSATNVTVCQVTLDTIIYYKSNGVDLLNDVSRAVFKDRAILPTIAASPFLPIHSEYLTKYGFLRTTYLNMSNPYCLKKFVAPVYCGKDSCQIDHELEKSKKLEKEWKEFQKNLEQFEKDLKKIEDDFGKIGK